MSDVEFECRWTIVQAYAFWRLTRFPVADFRPLNMLAYARMLGVEL